MALLLFLSSLLFGSSVRDLGDADFATRDAAYKRLQRCSPWCSVELTLASHSPLPHTRVHGDSLSSRYSVEERRHRAAILLSRIPSFADWFYSRLVFGGDSPRRDCEEFLLASLADDVCRWIDENRLWTTSASTAWSSAKWVRQLPYATGTQHGDLLYVVSEVQQKRRSEFTATRCRNE